MTTTFELDLDWVKMNQHAEYLGQRSCRSKVIVLTHKHALQPTDRTTQTTEMVGKKT